MTVDQAAQYDEAYYATHCGPVPYARSSPAFLEHFNAMAAELVAVFHPARTFDAGCALGFLVEGLRDRGVEAWGRDISPFAISQVRPDIAPYCSVGSLTEPLPGRFDLVTCIEVLEHMPEAEGLAAVANLARSSDTIVMASSPDDFEEPTHVNVQPPLYWMEAFAEHGFEPDIGPLLLTLPRYALLLRRTETRPSASYLRACVEVLRARIETEKLAVPRHRMGQFDPDYYLRVNTDVAAAGLDALEHYVNHGRFEGRQPNEELANIVEGVAQAGLRALQAKRSGNP